MNDLRIISFLPAATEMVYALGLGDALVGVSHECDFPAAAKAKPVVVKPSLPLEQMTLSEIDVAVAERIGSGQSLYEVDENLLRELKPDLILTQNLCQVCGPSGNEITVALKALSPKPEIVWMTPHSIEEIFQNLRELGAATGCAAKAEQLVADARAHLQKISALMKRASHQPKVFCLEWVDPYYCCGHWVPEMIELAGGHDALGRKGADSVRIPWTDIAAWAPEILIVSPCGFGVEKAVEQAERLLQRPGWSELPAVRNGQVFAVNANAYFARPGPRVVDGVELLAHLIHPELCDWNGPDDAFRKIKSGSRGASAEGQSTGPASGGSRPATFDFRSVRVRIKVCPECGAEFFCGPKSGDDHCWCNELPPLPPSTAPGADCLCPVCLAKAIENLRAQKP